MVTHLIKSSLCNYHSSLLISLRIPSWFINMSHLQNIQVAVRCRPLHGLERNPVVQVIQDSHEVKVRDRSFYFDQVFAPEADQVDVYRRVVQPLIDQVLLGFNCTVFAYGQTGTGKTYTMEGDRSDEELSWEDDPHCGVIPRAISQLFETLKDHDNEFTVRVSFLELYNEDIYDLLGPLNDTTKLKVFEDANRKGSVIVGNLEEIIVQSKAEIFEILKRGSAKRQTAATLLNACSSRSHTIFSVTVHIKEGSVEDEELLKIGKLNLVDLAGSENIGRSGAQDKRAREAGNINQSLLTLGRVITALVEKRPHVPYRESKLTRLLQDSLGGKTKTSIIATISPAVADLEDTLSTLDYATRAKKITNKPEMNQRLAKKALLREYAKEIERLRKDLQATREKSGVYVDEDNYKEMCKQLSAGNSVVREKEERVIALEIEIEKSRKLFEEFSQRYQETKCELDNAKEWCAKQKKLIDAQKEIELELATQAAQLLKVAEAATTDNDLLHVKKERVENILKENRASIDRYHPKVTTDISRIESLFENYSKEFVSELDSFEDIMRGRIRSQISKLEARSKEIRQLAKDLQMQSDNFTRQAEQFETAAAESRKQSVNLISRIEVCTMHENELAIEAENLKNSEDFLSKLNRMKNMAMTMHSTGKRECGTLRQETDRLFTKDIKEDVITGTTPQKKTYDIPRRPVQPACDLIIEGFEEFNYSSLK